MKPETVAPSSEPTADGGPLVSIRNLETYYSIRGNFADRLVGREAGVVRAVDGVSLDIRRGEVLGLVGESGSGKTTLGRTLLGLVRATGGSVEFDGRDITRLREREFRAVRRKMQVVFQDPHASLNPAMTIAQAVGHPLQIHGLERDRSQQRARVADVLETVGLAPAEAYLDKYPGDLSGGQKQRAVIARALILNPVLLVADEPVSMLDMSVRAKILELMLALKRDFELTYL
jgi:ABC-type glutathione transport system ATPase component